MFSRNALNEHYPDAKTKDGIKKKYRSIFFMNINVRILNKIAS